jgi:hypothetical protein
MPQQSTEQEHRQRQHLQELGRHPRWHQQHLHQHRQQQPWKQSVQRNLGDSLSINLLEPCRLYLCHRDGPCDDPYRACPCRGDLYRGGLYRGGPCRGRLYRGDLCCGGLSLEDFSSVEQQAQLVRLELLV